MKITCDADCGCGGKEPASHCDYLPSCRKCMCAQAEEKVVMDYSEYDNNTLIEVTLPE